ncbi:MAG: hypothetical protein ACN4GW_12420, partial [Desulforhopalus sp.]
QRIAACSKYCDFVMLVFLYDRPLSVFSWATFRNIKKMNQIKYLDGSQSKNKDTLVAINIPEPDPMARHRTLLIKL